MNDNTIIYELSDNIKSSTITEQPLKNWFIAIFIPIIIMMIICIIVLICCISIFDPSYNNKSYAYIVMLISCIIFLFLEIYYYRNLYFRALRVDKYINRKQQFFELIQNYYIYNNKDLGNEYNTILLLLKNISIFRSFTTRVVPIFKTTIVITISTVLVKSLLYTTILLYIMCVITNIIVHAYYIYLENIIWYKIFTQEKQIYQAFYSSLEEYEQVVLISEIPVNRFSYINNLVLCILTFGLYYSYWDYKIHTAPDKTFPYIHTVEEDIYNKITSQHCWVVEQDIKENI